MAGEIQRYFKVACAHPSRRPIVLGSAAAGCACPAAGTDPAGANPPPRTTPTRSRAAAQPATRTAKLISAELRQIRVIAARPPVPGYKRDQFGQTWTGNHAGRGGHNGCDTRIICTRGFAPGHESGVPPAQMTEAASAPKGERPEGRGSRAIREGCTLGSPLCEEAR